jgi:nucleoside-diphosphate-sugar epimerase
MNLANILEVTGGSGHLGFRVLVSTLEAGYKVRAAVRSEAKASAIKAASSVRRYLDSLEFIIVPDILADGAYDDAVKGVTYILHSASPISFPTDNPERDLIAPAVNGTTGILKSAAKVSSVKRIVITSSEVAIIPWADFIMLESETVWRDTNQIPEPHGPYGHHFEAYAASKVKALHASDAFIASEKPNFDIINIMPSFLVGKSELVTDLKNITKGTNGPALGPVLGTKSDFANPSTTVFVNDVAEIHVRALNPKIAGNQNFLVSSGSVKGTTWNDSIKIVKKNFPKAVERNIFPLDGTQPTKSTKVDSSRTEEVFGIKLASYETQVKSVVGHYLELLEKQ